MSSKKKEMIGEIEELSSSMETRIDWLLKLKTEEAHYDGWGILEKLDPESSSTGLWGKQLETKEEALAYLQSKCEVVPAEEALKERFFPDSSFVYQATNAFMRESPKDNPIPRVFCLSHKVFDGKMLDPDALNISDESIEIMKTAYVTFRKADIYKRCLKEFWLKHFDKEYSLSQAIQREMDKLADELKEKSWSENTQEKG